ncbi:hypothetical protein DFH07DRAFT_535224 [Mycena maculata]|uniref:Uncharacterized protein n=1 Tax=Mycena maculata TaxID=230809 RepID=A0AAD7NWY8_9AGAR|nr:hypothetical protein DFH07DRAFT_535224 [Mycena maculata]
MHVGAGGRRSRVGGSLVNENARAGDPERKKKCQSDAGFDLAGRVSTRVAIFTASRTSPLFPVFRQAVHCGSIRDLEPGPTFRRARKKKRPSVRRLRVPAPGEKRARYIPVPDAYPRVKFYRASSTLRGSRKKIPRTPFLATRRGSCEPVVLSVDVEQLDCTPAMHVRPLREDARDEGQGTPPQRPACCGSRSKGRLRKKRKEEA